MDGSAVVPISTEWLSARGSINDRPCCVPCLSGIGILSCGVVSLRRSFCRRCSVGARGEHSRSDAESGVVEAAGVEGGIKSISSGGARRLASLLPTPLMNESEHSHLCGRRLRRYGTPPSSRLLRPPRRCRSHVPCSPWQRSGQNLCHSRLCKHFTIH